MRGVFRPDKAVGVIEPQGVQLYVEDSMMTDNAVRAEKNRIEGIKDDKS